MEKLILSSQDTSIAIMGLGYVGLPLALEFSKHFNVKAFDINSKRISELSIGFDRNAEEDVGSYLKSNLSFTSNTTDILDCSVYIICVPTPTNSDNTPNLENLINASELVASSLSGNNLVIYESTVYPGATEDICIPILENTSGMSLNTDFFCGYSPERVSPGSNGKKITDIIKITSGSCSDALDLVDELYTSVIKAGTHRAKSIRVAESSKMLENIQRDVNIALMNEFSSIMDEDGIDINDVLSAAKTKWNFAPYFPGLVGGHCIAVDPYYLINHANAKSVDLPLMSLARKINNSMPTVIAKKVIKKIVTTGIDPNASRVLIFGLTFKENCKDLRNSKVFDLIHSLEEYGLVIDVYDPLLPLNLNSNLISNPFATTQKYSLIIKCVNHDDFSNYTNEQYTEILIPPGLFFNVTSMSFKDL